MRAILDTSVVLAADVGTLEGELAISAITLAQMHFGVLAAKTGSVRAERLRQATAKWRLPWLTPADNPARAQWTYSLPPPRPRTQHGFTHGTSTTSSASMPWLTLCPYSRVAQTREDATATPGAG
ncbi:MAG: twitching motility protein PilT [Pseudonocardiales bacterium]|nr:twitching motility protein PilT [Pseudonocardiales bacterium]